ncbi:CPBP family intramembrane glutamic endopeptidase [Brevundimonas sp.]|uniref:CPBP family intramembrane glutamic endopeptidase n=1 Tax=Brevundimonas sp. TaxID=1871086 RepID=UPI00286C222F|nr:CPBP family intramembrane glutamic endopeptidase [Brevundimonas sp.]
MSPYEALVRAVPVARRSPMITGFKPDRPWLKLGGFIALAMLLMVVVTIILDIIVRIIPGATDQLSLSGPFPETPLRLIDESVNTLLLAAILGGMALAILAAAALIYRRRLSDFLWPGRRFNAWDLGVGFLAMACVSVILFPFYLLMGGEWTPPLLGPTYADWTRPVFVVASIIGLLGAAAAEEVICRGVLLRLTTQLMRHPVVVCLINGLLFSALHLDPDPVAYVARALSGAIWTWAAIRLGGLEFAIGAHLANNLMICLFWQPLSAMEVGADSEWIQLAPEVFVAVVMLVVVERLADGPRDWRPARSAPRGTA